MKRPINIKHTSGDVTIVATDGMSSLPPETKPRRRGGGSACHGNPSIYTGIRMPKPMREQLKTEAQKEGLTLSAIICKILTESLTP